MVPVKLRLVQVILIANVDSVDNTERSLCSLGHGNIVIATLKNGARRVDVVADVDRDCLEWHAGCCSLFKRGNKFCKTKPHASATEARLFNESVASG